MVATNQQVTQFDIPKRGSGQSGNVQCRRLCRGRVQSSGNRSRTGIRGDTVNQKIRTIFYWAAGSSLQTTVNREFENEGINSSNYNDTTPMSGQLHPVMFWEPLISKTVISTSSPIIMASVASRDSTSIIEFHFSYGHKQPVPSASDSMKLSELLC